MKRQTKSRMRSIDRERISQIVSAKSVESESLILPTLTLGDFLPSVRILSQRNLPKSETSVGDPPQSRGCPLTHLTDSAAAHGDCA